MNLPQSALLPAAMCALLTCLLAPTAFPQRAEIPEGMYFGLTTPGSPDGDDQGPPQEIKMELYKQSGSNLIGAGCNWGDAEAKDPGNAQSKYDWSKFDKDLARLPKGMEIILSIGLGAPWASGIKKEEEERYWRLAERFMAAAARHARTRHNIKYYRVPGNEPSLTMKSDWHVPYMDVAKRYYKAIKAGHPDNKVLVGALVVGSQSHIGALYGSGLKGNFDILNLHCYGRDKETVSMDQVLEAHQVLVDHGDGDKRIYLEEGWACFPLPQSIENKADGKDLAYTPEQIEHYRQRVLNGYRNLTTPRDGFDPKWIWGAKFFTMNDFWGSMHWKERGIPVYKDDGETIDHYVLDGYYIPYSPDALDPKYRPWGLVDKFGKPKGDTIFNFPPYIPKHEFAGKIEGAGRTVDPGTYTVTLRVVNREEKPFTNVRFGIYAREPNWRKGEDLRSVKFAEIPRPARLELKPGEAAVQQYQMTVPPELAGKSVRAYGEFWFDWQGRPYYTDAWINFQVEK